MVVTKITSSEFNARWDPNWRIDLSESPFGHTEEGYKDYRGFPLSRYRKVLGREFVKCDLTKADFSNTELEGLAFIDCIFRSVDFSNTVERECSFVSVRFETCDFYLAALGFGTSRYEDCVLEKNNFAGAIFQNAIFQKCTLSNNKLKGVDFNVSGFWDCRFSGILTDVCFRGNYQLEHHRKKLSAPKKVGLHRVNFEQAELSWITVTHNCPLEELTMTKNGSSIVCNFGMLWSMRKDQFLNRLTDDERKKCENYLSIYSTYLNIEGIPQNWMIISYHDIVTICGGQLGSLLYSFAKIFECHQKERN